MSLDVAIETDWDEIFDKEPGVGETFHILFRGCCDLSLGGTKISKSHSNIPQFVKEKG
jgi:hypothetical protein